MNYSCWLETTPSDKYYMKAGSSDGGIYIFHQHFHMSPNGNLSCPQHIKNQEAGLQIGHLHVCVILSNMQNNYWISVIRKVAILIVGSRHSLSLVWVPFWEITFQHICCVLLQFVMIILYMFSVFTMIYCTVLCNRVWKWMRNNWLSWEKLILKDLQTPMLIFFACCLQSFTVILLL